MFDLLGKTLEKRQGGWLSPPPLVRPRVNFPPSFSPQVFFCFLSFERRDIHRTTSPTSFRHCQKDFHYGTFTVFAFGVIVKEALLDEFRGGNDDRNGIYSSHTRGGSRGRVQGVRTPSP